MASVQQPPAVQHPSSTPYNQAQVQEMFMVRYSKYVLYLCLALLGYAILILL
jgi:hypothetical protein